jgi:hypothetical protein
MFQSASIGKRFDNRSFVGISAATLFVVAAVGLTSSLGCQVLLPSKLTKFGEDRRILKQAEHDPFPSPADVGLETPKDEKK